MGQRRLVPSTVHSLKCLIKCPSLQFEAISRYIPPVFVSLFFSVHATLEIHAAGEGLHETLDVLEETLFPNSPTIRGLRGLIYYHVRGTSLPSFLDA
jgi:hypothetical protein